MLLLQCSKESGDSGDSAQEWMGRLQVKAADCKCKENDRRLKEKFNNGMNDEAIAAEIIIELTVLKDTSEVSSEQVLVRVQSVEVQRAQKAVLESIRDAEDFDSVGRDRQRPDQKRQQRGVERKRK